MIHCLSEVQFHSTFCVLTLKARLSSCSTLSYKIDNFSVNIHIFLPLSKDTILTVIKQTYNLYWIILFKSFFFFLSTIGLQYCSFLVYSKVIQWYRICVCLHVCVCSRLFYNAMDCSPSGSFVRGIFQARLLEWITISFSRRFSWPRDWTYISCTGRLILYFWTTRAGCDEIVLSSIILMGEKFNAIL